MSSKLDTYENIRELDKSGMYEKIFNFPEQIEEASEIGKSLNFDPEYFRNLKNIILVGMGGSAIGGDIIRSFLLDKLKIPFQICRNYRLPVYVNNNSLVIASSYSGNTEETLSAFNEAVNRNARLFCLTTGGQLSDLVSRQNILEARLPTGYQPRAALGFSLIPLLYFLAKIGLIDNPAEEIAELIPGLKNYRRQYAIDSIADKNPAKQIALKLQNRIPIIYTGPDLIDIVGSRWKGQFCENAECLAFNNQFPEMNHNELVGFNKIESYRDKLVVIYLRDSDDHAQVTKRMAVVSSLLDKKGIEIITVYSQGDFRLGRVFSLIQIGDFASFYLSILNGVDPTPVKLIDYLKKELS